MKAPALLLLVLPILVPSQPLRLDTYPCAGAPAPRTCAPYPDPSVDTLVMAGDSLPLVAKLFDQGFVWLPVYETPSAPVSWRLVAAAGPLGGTLSRDTGCCATFMVTRAYSRTYVIAEFDSGGTVLRDTVSVYGIPRPMRFHVVVEPDLNWQASPWADNPVDTIQLWNSDACRAYAVVRDTFGNYVQPCPDVEWRVRDPALVDIVRTLDSAGVEIRMDSTASVGQTQLVAVCHTCSDSDSVVVDVFRTWPYADSLRVVDGLTGEPLSSLPIAVGEERHLVVQAQLSDRPDWVRTLAFWSVAPGSDTVDLGVSLPYGPAMALGVQPVETGVTTLQVVGYPVPITLLLPVYVAGPSATRSRPVARRVARAQGPAAVYDLRGRALATDVDRGKAGITVITGRHGVRLLPGSGMPRTRASAW